MFALQSGANCSEVELKVMLPDKSIMSVRIQRNFTTDKVYKVKLGPISIKVDVDDAPLLSSLYE